MLLTSIKGEVESPLPLNQGDQSGELRLKSDFALARDSRTSCAWQGFIDQQHKMADAFRRVMAKLAIIGSNRRDLVDCSEVIPKPKPADKKHATYAAF